MNLSQKQQILDVISKDCTIQNKYFGEDNPKEDCCVIGGLAIAAGISDEKIKFIIETNNPSGLLNYNQSYIYLIHEPLEDLRNLICKRFGLEESNLACLQMENDRNDDLQKRREKCKEYINSLPISE